MENLWFGQKVLPGISKSNPHLAHQTIEDAIKTNFYKRPEVIAKLAVLEQEVLSKKKSTFDAAGELLGL